MKRNMDLIRKILLKAEEHPDGFMPHNFVIEGFDENTMGYHIYLMGQAGLVDVLDRNLDMARSPSAILLNLTWQGHEFLENSRNPNIWEQAKSVIGKAGEGSFAVWQSVLTDLVKRSIGFG